MVFIYLILKYRHQLTLQVLGVTLDEELTLDNHVSGIVRVRSYHLCALRYIYNVNHDTPDHITCSLIDGLID